MNNSAVPAPSEPRKQQRTLSLGLLTLSLLVLVGISLHAQIATLFGPHVPPPPCGQSSLLIGTTKFLIQNLTPKSNSDLGIPSGKPKVAFWLQGTTGHYVFALSPTSDNTTLMQGLFKGEPIKISWGDCSSDEFALASSSNTISQPSEIMTQSEPGITVIVPQEAGSQGWILKGQRPEVHIPSVTDTPNPNEVQADISFVDQSTSTDGKTLTLKIAVRNTGSGIIHLSESDISLGGIAPSSIDPSLPVDIQPGASQALTLTFAKPSGNTAVFKILDFSVDLYF